MSLGTKLTKGYFDFIYNPVYDFTTAQLASYRRLQSTCIGKLEFDAGDKILCVGVGTGNEVVHILGMNRNVGIVGVDYSHTALEKAYQKALAMGRRIEGFVMDACNLEFAAGSFDKVLCIHVMDFVEEKEKATDEILRVLRNGGQFAITYPSDNEGIALGLNLLKDGIRDKVSLGKSRLRAFAGSLIELLAGVLYLPLLLRQKKSCSYNELTTLFSEMSTGPFQIERYPLYQDFIVSGQKINKVVKTNEG